MGTWGWIIAGKQTHFSAQDLASRLKQLKFDSLEVAFLNPEAMLGMMQFWKGAFDNIDAVAINTMMDPVIDQYYREAEWGF
jgi:hypothetical protein